MEANRKQILSCKPYFVKYYTFWLFFKLKFKAMFRMHSSGLDSTEIQ